jgi:hypothetical protein
MSSDVLLSQELPIQGFNGFSVYMHVFPFSPFFVLFLLCVPVSVTTCMLAAHLAADSSDSS